jgi:hypothetical protein
MCRIERLVVVVRQMCGRLSNRRMCECEGEWIGHTRDVVGRWPHPHDFMAENCARLTTRGRDGTLGCLSGG